MPQVSISDKSKIVSLNFFLSFDGEFYQYVASSEYSHIMAMGMANYLGKALITGCYEQGNDWLRSICGLKTEIMDMGTLTWSSAKDYPSHFIAE